MTAGLAGLSSEFASVEVAVDKSGNGPRLRIEDMRTGRVGYLDPLELEMLAWLPEHGLDHLLDPSLHRWRDPDLGLAPGVPKESN